MMDNQPIYYKNRLIQIFRDHWEPFKRFYPSLVDDDIETNVQKMMDCGLFYKGYAEYRCRCGHITPKAFGVAANPDSVRVVPKFIQITG